MAGSNLGQKLRGGFVGRAANFVFEVRAPDLGCLAMRTSNEGGEASELFESGHDRSAFDETDVAAEAGVGRGGEAAAKADTEASGETSVFSEETEIFAGSFDGAEAAGVNVAGVFVGHVHLPS